MLLIYADVRYGADPVLETLHLLLLLTGGIIRGGGVTCLVLFKEGKRKGLMKTKRL